MQKIEERPNHFGKKTQKEGGKPYVNCTSCAPVMMQEKMNEERERNKTGLKPVSKTVQ